MLWSALLVCALHGPVPTQDVAATSVPASYASYGEAWKAAQEVDRPLLVILNPAEAQGAIHEQELRDDAQLQPLMDQYVVAVIDTTTEQGKVIHELFESPALPRVVVIDKNQKEQIFRTSEKLSHEQLANVLTEHKDGEIKVPAPKVTTTRVMQFAQPAGYCPTCVQQRRWVY